MASLNEIDDSSHYLLMPRNVRLNLEKWGDGEWTQKEGVTMEWDSLARVPMAPRDSVQCLWDLVDLSQVHPSQFPQRLLAFVAIWGIINFDAIYMELDRPSSSDVHWSWCLSQILQATLVGLVSTEEEDLVDDETILRIAGWEFNEKTKIEHDIGHKMPSNTLLGAVGACSSTIPARFFFLRTIFFSYKKCGNPPTIRKTNFFL